MEINYQLEAKDVSALFYYIWRTRVNIGGARLALFFALIFLMDDVAALPQLGGPRVFVNSVMWTGLALANVGALLTLITNVIYPWLLKRNVLKDPQIFCQRYVRISPMDFCARYPLGEMTTRWQALSEVTADRDYLYVFANKTSGWIIPKRCFASSEQGEDFFLAAKQYWETAKMLPVVDANTEAKVWPPPPRSGNSQEPDAKP